MIRTNRLPALAAALLFGTCLAGSAHAQPRQTLGVTAGNVIIEPSTLISIGLEWPIVGDEDRDSSVAVAFRKKGETAWKNFLPMLRTQNEEVLTAFPGTFKTGNAFIGSIFDLQPATDYEVRLVLSDPDGVKGQREKLVNVRTRAEPMQAAGGKTYHVYPGDWKGDVVQPAFYGLYAAYYDNSDVGSERWNAYPARVQPGDTILVHGGLYKDRWDVYWTTSMPAPAPANHRECCGTTFDGTYYLTASGTAEKPIVIKAAGDGEVIFDGGGNHTLFNLMGSNYNYFEDITFRNTDVAIDAGKKRIAGGEGLTVKKSKFLNVGIGISTDWSGAKNFYIADNVFVGKHNPRVLVPFDIDSDNGKRFAADGATDEDRRNLSFAAIKIYGSGHVVAYNSFRNFHDGIAHSIYGLPDGYPNMIRDRMPVSNDYYNNDMSNMHDDCFEIDGQVYNIRLLRNRCVNAAGSAFSTQPLFGGAAYIVRNAVYNIPGGSRALKFAGSSGELVYNNTFVSAEIVAGGIGPISNGHFRNNLVLSGTPTAGAFSIATFTDYTSSDYNGFMSGAQARNQFAWRGPKPGIRQSYEVPVELRTPDNVYPAYQIGNQRTRSQLVNEGLVQQNFPTLATYQQATGQDRNSRLIDLSIFESMRATDYDQPTRVYDPTKLNFRIRAGSAAVDGGTVLPGITEGFTGAAPDLGAVELGQSEPHYGPR